MNDKTCTPVKEKNEAERKFWELVTPREEKGGATEVMKDEERINSKNNPNNLDCIGGKTETTNMGNESNIPEKIDQEKEI